MPIFPLQIAHLPTFQGPSFNLKACSFTSALNEMCSKQPFHELGNLTQTYKINIHQNDYTNYADQCACYHSKLRNAMNVSRESNKLFYQAKSLMLYNVRTPYPRLKSRVGCHTRLQYITPFDNTMKTH
jgi:hypothetical protein